MRIVVTGGTGFVGKRLVQTLAERGDEVVVLSRRPDEAGQGLPKGARAAGYEPTSAKSLAKHVDGADAVIHLAGESVAQRWNDEIKRRIISSRIDTTRAVVEAMASVDEARRPRVLACASAIGYYGPHDDDVHLDETAAPGEDFLAKVVVDWEAEAERATALGVRVARLRIGIVLGPDGGPLEQMARPFKLGVGGPVAGGRQIVSWIHLDDVIGLFLLALDDERAAGAVNLVAPAPVTNAELSKAIGRALRRPSWIPVPKFAVSLVFGEAATALTSGQHVVPRRAQELGYAFRHETVDDALRASFA